MKTRLSSAPRLKQAMASPVIFTAFLAFGIITLPVASAQAQAQDIAIYGGGGGGGGNAAGGGSGGNGGHSGNSGGLGGMTTGTAGNASPASTGEYSGSAGAGGGVDQGGGAGAAYIQDTGSYTNASGLGAALDGASGSGNNGGSAADITVELDLATNISGVKDIILSAGQGGVNAVGVPNSGGNGGSVMLQDNAGFTSGTLSLSGNIKVSTQAALVSGNSGSEGSAVLYLHNRVVSMLSGTIDITSGTESAEVEVKSLSGTNVNITVDAATVTGRGTASFYANSADGVTGAGIIDIKAAHGGDALFTSGGDVETSGNILLTAGSGNGAAIFQAADVVRAGGNVVLKSGSGFSADANFTAGTLEIADGKDLTLDASLSTNAKTYFVVSTLYAKGDTDVTFSSAGDNMFTINSSIKAGDGSKSSTLSFTGPATSFTHWGPVDLELNRAKLDMSGYGGTYDSMFGAGNYYFENISAAGGSGIKGVDFTIGATMQYDYNISLSTAGLANGEAVLNFEDSQIDFTGYSSSVNINTSGTNLLNGTPQAEIDLIKASGTGTVDGIEDLEAQVAAADKTKMVQYGVGTYYSYDLEYDNAGTGNDRLFLRYNGGGDDTFDLYPDAGTAQILTLTQSGQLISDAVYRVAYRKDEGAKMGLTMAGFNYKNSVGSSIEVDGFGAVLTLGYTFEGTSSRFTTGGFVEAGSSGYDAYNTISVYGNTKGDGETKYFGGGLYAHNIYDSGFYLEGSLRAGRAEHDFKYQGHAGHQYNDKSTTYYGAHAGAGYKFSPGWERGEFDVYAKAAWTHMEGYSFRLSAIEKMEMDDINSYHSRIGGRYSHTYDNGTSLYIGAAWDHEFNGKSKGGLVGGQKILGTAETKGSSAFFETGLLINPADTPVSIDLGIFGSAGQNRGIGGTVGFKWEF